MLLLVVFAIVAASVIPFVTVSAIAPSGTPAVTFNKTFGGAASDEGWDVVQTNGGYVAVGYTGSFTSDYTRQVYIVKTDTSGNKVWEKAIGDSGNDYGVTIKPTSDGGFIIAGWTDSYGRGDDVLLLKIDANGNKQWSTAFGGALEDRGMGVVQTNDGGYAICGWTYSAGTTDRAIWLIKTNAAGSMKWNETFGGGDSDYGYGLVQSRDGGLVLTGAVASTPTIGDRDVVLIKTDANGKQLFYKTYGGAKSDYGQEVVETSDGGFFITGWTWSFGAGDKDVYVVKTDGNGNKAWDKTYGGPYAEHGYSGRQTSDGGYVVTGDTIVTNGSYEDAYVGKIDSTGSLLWNATLSGPKCDAGYSIKQTSDDGYIIAGETHSSGAGSGDLYLVKLGASVPSKIPSNLTCTVSTSKVKVNSPFQIKGRLISGDAAAVPLGGQTVVLQKYSGKSWVNVKSTKTDASGLYSITQTCKTGTYQYRSIYYGNATYLAATSTTVQIKVG
ncbi:MAG: hypothetical protein ACXV3E_00310 [Halobacteriota archaeon]